MNANIPENVLKLGELNLEGNVIPHNWFQTIKLKSGKPDINAIVILSEIVYWHRPMHVKDEETGSYKGMKKRFKSDLLQRSYQSFATQFGFSKRQVQDAIKRLEERGLISRVFRDIQTQGIALSNVLFIDVVPENIRGVTFNSDRTNVEIQDPSRLVTDPPTFKRDTPRNSSGDVYRDYNRDYYGDYNRDYNNKEHSRETDDVSQKRERQNQSKEIIDYLNQATGKRFKPGTQKTKTCINARMDEGFTLDDFKRVIDVKTKEWKDKPEMNVYLRPETLFGNKFEGYLNQPDVTPKKATKNQVLQKSYFDITPEEMDMLNAQEKQEKMAEKNRRKERKRREQREGGEFDDEEYGEITDDDLPF